MIRFLISLFLISDILQAKDLGTFGETFSIKEESLVDVIQRKLKNMGEKGELEKHQKVIQERVKEKVMNPDPIKGIIKARSSKSFTYDPSITVPYDLKDHEGHVFHRKGTKINPLNHKSLTKPLLFIDGEDEEQVKWATLQYEKDSRTKMILVKGSPFKMAKEIPFYFDQNGTLVKKLGIEEVPARVSQQDLHLLIEIISLEEGTSYGKSE